MDNESSGESDGEDGYDSEAAEVSKGGRIATTERSSKRRKLSQSEDEDFEQTFMTARDIVSDQEDTDQEELQITKDEDSPTPATQAIPETDHKIESDSIKPVKKRKEKEEKRGVIYLSSLPPYLKPSALRNLLVQRGFEPITRLFLTPASKAKASSKKNSRQLYTEGWIEFGSKKTARRCAESLNASIIGGRKGGFYHDDLWNMKYLRGMGWDELMAGIREERREEEGRRDEERRIIDRETKRFVEGVEEGRRVEGMKKKRKAKGTSGKETEDVKRTWNQFGVKGNTSSREGVSSDVQNVLGKIF